MVLLLELFWLLAPLWAYIPLRVREGAGDVGADSRGGLSARGGSEGSGGDCASRVEGDCG